jgi:hypothetical protein
MSNFLERLSNSYPPGKEVTAELLRRLELRAITTVNDKAAKSPRLRALICTDSICR